MRLICSKCGMLFESLILDKELSWADCFKQSTSHVSKRHKDLGEELSKAGQLAMMSLMLAIHANEFLVIPEQETFCNDKLDGAIKMVMNAIGYDTEELPEDDDELEPNLDENGEVIDEEEEETEVGTEVGPDGADLNEIPLEDMRIKEESEVG